MPVIVSVAMPSSTEQSKQFAALSGTTPLVKEQLALLKEVVDEWAEKFNGHQTNVTCCYCAAEDDLMKDETLFTGVYVSRDEFRKRVRLMNQLGGKMRMVVREYTFRDEQAAAAFVQHLTLLKFICSVAADGRKLLFPGWCRNATNKCQPRVKVSVLESRRNS